MRYLVVLAVAMALTITWQTSVVADNPVIDTPPCSGQTTSDDQATTQGTDEPECD